jgi:hypothetical protein
LCLDLDVHKDTPNEGLHTWLLGAEKYKWHLTNTKWDHKKDAVFAVRLNSAFRRGLSGVVSLNARYIAQYKNSLIGRHLEATEQLGVFQLRDDLSTETMFQLWCVTGELGAYLWFPEIDLNGTYLVSLYAFLHSLTTF